MSEGSRWHVAQDLKAQSVLSLTFWVVKTEVIKTPQKHSVRYVKKTELMAYEIDKLEVNAQLALGRM